MQTLEKDRVPHNQVTREWFEPAHRYHVHFTLEVVFQKILEPEEIVCYFVKKRKINKNVNIAVGASCVAGHRTKDRDTPHAE